MLKVLYSKNLNFKVKMGLENMIVFNQKLGNPAGQITTIHVTGTNGKGSVVHKIAKALQASGYKTGMYVSPHISSFRERITINGEMISEDDVVKYLDRINKIEPSLPTSLTFFESVTGMAFDYFKEKQVDVAVVEVGLGGRLDSTNIITPELSVITSIGLDHQGILGNTITDIAREKARQEGKKEEMLDKIAQGRLNKFYKESCLLEQEYIMDAQLTIEKYLKSIDPELTAVAFKRVNLNED